LKIRYVAQLGNRILIRKIFQNSISNTGIMFLKMGVAFFLTPCIVHALGNHDYGIYEIVFSVIGYMGMLELGIQPAVTKFVAGYAAKGDETSLRKIFCSALTFSCVIGLLISVALMIWAFSGAKGIVAEGELTSRYVTFLIIVACQVLVSLPGNVLESVHHGHQRYWLTSMLTTINVLIGTVIVYLLLNHGYGLLTLTLANAIGGTIKYVNYAILLSLKKFGGYVFSPRYVSKDTIRELLNFGLKSFVLGIATRIRNSTDAIVLGSVIGPSVVVFYVIPSNLVNYLRNMISALSLGLMPLFSDIHSTNDVNTVWHYYNTISKYVVAIACCGLLGILFLGPNFIELWMGAEYARQGKTVLYIMTAVFGMQLPNLIQGRMLTGLGKHGWIAKVKMVEAIFNLGISIILAKYMGKEGVAVGTLIPAFIVEPLSVVMVCRLLNGSILDYCAKVLVPLILPAAGSITYYYVAISRSYPMNYLGVFFTAIIGSSIFIILYVVLLNSVERNKLKSYASSRIKK